MSHLFWEYNIEAFWFVCIWDKNRGLCERNLESECILIQFRFMQTASITNHFHSILQRHHHWNTSPLNHSVGVGLQQGPENEDIYSPHFFPRERMFPSLFISYANSPSENTVNEWSPKCLFSPFSVQQKSPMVTRKVSLKWPRQVAKQAREESLQSIVRTSQSSQ